MKKVSVKCLIQRIYVTLCQIKNNLELLFFLILSIYNEPTASDLTQAVKYLNTDSVTVLIAGGVSDLVETCQDSHSCFYIIFLACVAACCSRASQNLTFVHRGCNYLAKQPLTEEGGRKKNPLWIWFWFYSSYFDMLWVYLCSSSCRGSGYCFIKRMKDILKLWRENGSVNHQRPHKAWPGEN